MKYNELSVTASHFIDSKLRLYSAYSNVRGIPFIGDGMKKAHRQATWGMMKRGENADKDTVERIAARAASDTDYAHGVGSLEGTIVTLAQNFAGSNNLPIFEQHGQFGNRLKKEASATRYIKTKLHQNFRKLFPKADDILFEFVISNGMEAEPRYFTPILPLVLINGANGMGTGHSCNILSYNPTDIQQAILKLLDGKTIRKNTLLPWWNGFNGTVVRDKTTGQVTIEGKYEIRTGRTPTIVITELPIGQQSEPYEKHLQKLEDWHIGRKDNPPPKIHDFDNLSDEASGFEFIVRCPRTTLQLSDEELKKMFKLVSRETENFTVWDGDGAVKKYDTAEDLLEDFVIWRTERYEDRRQAQMKKVKSDIIWAGLKIRFIRFYLANYQYFRDTGSKELAARLVTEGFDRHTELLDMPMRNLTKDKIAELEKDVEDLKAELKGLEGDDAISMYTRELKALKL